MFTIKHCEGGIENLYADIQGVTYRGPHADCGPSGVDVLFKDGNSKLFGGNATGPFPAAQTIYVMNESGKTVATYCMGPAHGGLSGTTKAA